VRDNLLYGKRFSKDRPVIMTLDTVTGLLDLEGLLHRKPFQLSGGERQRVAIGRALLSQPELILMDEPFSNLDRNRRREIISYLLEINRQYSLPLLVISHDIEDVLKLTSSLVIIDEGRITASGSHDAVADDDDAHDVIGYSAYTNIIDLLCTGTSDNGTLLACTPPNSKAGILMKTGRPKTGNTDPVNRMVRFQLSPNDIVLSSSMLPGMSIQNQLKGTITRMHRESGSCFVHADCGIKLVAEITEATYNRMDIRPGADIYCLIKAKALQTIHVF
ncbi:MAG: ATP-binding cassette domain-containing protein, partial [Spirochaetota bacterium]